MGTAKDNHILSFWNWINNLPEKEAKRAQNHCKYFLGGKITGLITVNKMYQLKIN
jgi:hypothetical protein